MLVRVLGCILHQVLHLTPTLHKDPDFGGQNARLHSFSRWIQLPIGVLYSQLPLWDSGEVNVVLLNDGRIEAVEVQEEDEAVVESL